MDKKENRFQFAKTNFPQLEKEILDFWEKNQIFEKSLEKNQKGKRFVFFEGPPTANGRPGIHHVLARAFKDLIPRYKTMRGYFVERKAGWDTHGLPVELEVEKLLGVTGKPKIEEYGVEKFNEQCRSNVWRYKGDWEEMTRRLGFWLDLAHPYITYENSYIESLWWIIKQIWDKKLLYLGHKIVPQCPRCGTALSSHEVAQGYRRITESSLYLKFELAEEPKTYVLAWTTTPWTLPGNVALAVGPEITYVKIKQGDEFYILAKEALKVIDGEYEIVSEMSGKELEGKKYIPLFDFLDLEKLSGKKAYYLALADFVNLEEGTGVVHTAVMYGEDDYNLGKKIDLPKKHTVDENGYFTDVVKKWAGKFVKDKEVEKEITQYLRDKGLLYKVEDYTHDYPFCWRCESPLLYYAKNSWFIKMSALRERLIANNQKINWVPAYIKEGRFGEWLKEVKDWAVSRERYWGTPLPIWQCEKCNERKCVGSIEELKKEASNLTSQISKLDLHRPQVDQIKLKCACGAEMKRVPEVLDCWFDSGAMPFAQWHYPFENKERIDQGISYPADYIAEAIDQTRGWFYTLLAISTLLDKGTCYKNVICLGHILDTKGRKMSKRLGNIIDPWEVFDKYGADPLRWHFYTMNQPGDTKLFNVQQVADVVKKVFLIFANVIHFFKMYAGDINLSKDKIKIKNVLDQWILARFNLLIQKVTHELENYQITNATRQLGDFINELSTWYLRRSRKCFKSEKEEEKKEAFYTLYQVLFGLAKLIAPFIPFTAEYFYHVLEGPKESVHLEDWPEADKTLINQDLIKKMDMVRKVVEVGHSLRAEASLRVRQPLAQFVCNYKIEEFSDILKEELNIKEIHIKDKLPVGSEWLKREIGDFKAALDITVTDELKEEGLVREIIRNINAFRKKAGLTIKDKITIYYQTKGRLSTKIFKRYGNKFKNEVIANQIIKAKEGLAVEGLIFQGEFRLEEERVRVGFSK